MQKRTTKKPVEHEEKIVEKTAGPKVFDYKDPSTLAKYVTERGRIIPRSRSGLSASEQRELAKAVKRSRMIALMPFSG